MKCPKCNCIIDVESYNKNGRCSECGYPLKDDPDFVNKLLRSGEKKKNRVRYTKMDSVSSEGMSAEVKEWPESAEMKSDKTISKSGENLKKTPVRKEKVIANDVSKKASDNLEETHKAVNSSRKKIISSSARKKITGTHENNDLIESDFKKGEKNSIEEINNTPEQHSQNENTDGDPVLDFEFETEEIDDFGSTDTHTGNSNTADNIDNPEFSNDDLEEYSAEKIDNDRVTDDEEVDLSLLKNNRNKKIEELEKPDFKSDESNQSISGFLKIKLRTKFEKEFPGVTKGFNFIIALKKKHNSKNEQLSGKGKKDKSDQVDKRHKKKKIQSLEKETNDSWSSNRDGYYNDMTYNNIPKADRISFRSIARVVVVFVIMWLLASFLIYYV